MSKSENKSISAVDRVSFPALAVIYLLSFVLAGGFFEWVSCLLAVLLSAYLLFVVIRSGVLNVNMTFLLLAVTVTVAAHLVVLLWAVDRGMALIGFAKFLPLPLFLLALEQISIENRKRMLSFLLPFGTVMTVASFFLMMIPALKDYFSVYGRLAGFFQYPNTFALFLLVGVIVLASKARLKLRDYICLAVLLAGIALSGSRSVFVLTVLFLVYFICAIRERKTRIILISVIAALLLISIVYVLVTGKYETVGRFLTISLNNSSLLNRLLYYHDAIPVILRHPFGLGYMGYFYTQGSFQTGLYSVINVHNELLQILLDVGWIPAVMCVYACVKALLRVPKREKLIIIAIVLHSLFDFDLQFISIGFVLLLAMDSAECRTKSIKKSTILKFPLILVALYGIWLGIATGLHHSGNSEAAVRVYPGYTVAHVNLLQQAETAEEMDAIADSIISRNESVSIAYSAKAKAAFSNGDFENVIKHKKRAITLSRYTLAEYLDYADMLIVGEQLYTQHGDTRSAENCVSELVSIPEQLDEVRTGTSALALIIKEPELDLPDEYTFVIDQLRHKYSF